MNKIRSYLDPLYPVNVQTKNQHLSDSAYTEVVQKMIIPCTDVVFYQKNPKAVYLAQRSIFPMKGVWCIGGRMWFNDKNGEESISRCVQIETGIKIVPDRFKLIATNLYSWSKVEQGDFPGRNLALTFSCELSPKEVELVSQGLSSKEYDKKFGLQAFDRARLEKENVHPAMLDAYKEIF